MIKILAASLLHCSYVLSSTVETRQMILSAAIEAHQMILNPFTAAVGDVLWEIEKQSKVFCSVMCASNIRCNGVNYYRRRSVCTLLHVQDVQEDWEKKDDDVTFICMDCDLGSEGEMNYLFRQMLTVRGPRTLQKSTID